MAAVSGLLLSVWFWGVANMHTSSRGSYKARPQFEKCVHASDSLLPQSQWRLQASMHIARILTYMYSLELHVYK